MRDARSLFLRFLGSATLVEDCEVSVGHFVSAHVLLERADFSQLNNLPPSIGYRVYFHRRAQLYLIDTFRSTRLPAFPFQSRLPAMELSSEIPRDYEGLRTLHAQLVELGQAAGFCTTYMNYCRMASRLLAAPLLSIVSDDDELDFACLASHGRLERVHCICGGLRIVFDQDALRAGVVIGPSADEPGAIGLTPNEAHPPAAIATLQSALPQLQTFPPLAMAATDLHVIALDELTRFIGRRVAMLGLGQFDPPRDEINWELRIKR